MFLENDLEYKIRPLVIAEAATNHEGDIEVAKKIITAAACSGADYIKFQSSDIETMPRDHPHRKKMSNKVLSNEDHYELLEECKINKIKFLTTCFDWRRIQFLKKLSDQYPEFDTIKVASTDTGSNKMLKLLRDAFGQIILSTGMSYLDEIESAIKILNSDNKSFILMHCVSNYPTSIENANLKRIFTIRKLAKKITNKDIDIGYSDHTLGNDAVKIAMSMGAKIIEKHFTLKKDSKNNYSNMCALPEDLKEITGFAKKIPLYLGDGHIQMQPGEATARKAFRGRWGDNR